MRWLNPYGADSKQLHREIEEPLRAWHAWYTNKLDDPERESSNEASKKALLTDAVLLFGGIILGTMWRNGSPYGRFARGPDSVQDGWWNKECTEPKTRYRKARGTPLEQAQLSQDMGICTPCCGCPGPAPRPCWISRSMGFFTLQKRDPWRDLDHRIAPATGGWFLVLRGV